MLTDLEIRRLSKVEVRWLSEVEATLPLKNSALSLGQTRFDFAQRPDSEGFGKFASAGSVTNTSTTLMTPLTIDNYIINNLQ